MAMRPVWLVLGLAVAAASAAPQPSHASRIVCWTDEHGRRACGDRVPPQYAKQERQVYDSAGRLIETRPRQKTFEEAEEERRRTAELEARRKRAQEQSAYDRFLLTTFTSEESLEQNEKGIEQLESQIADVEAEGRAVPVRLTRQLREFEQSFESNRQVVDKLREEREAIRVKFDQDIERYRALTGMAEPLQPADTLVPETEPEG
jgi:DNA repair exonuclease SbcCD ATPase subunit